MIDIWVLKKPSNYSQILSKYTEDTNLYKDINGKPYLNSSDMHVSISHSKELNTTVLAVSDT